MKIVADEGIEARLVLGLREAGFTVIYIAELMPSVSDRVVLEYASRDKSILLTRDKDFGDLVFKDGINHYGIVLVRLKDTMSTLQKVEIVSNAFQRYSTQFQHAFSVIDENLVRIRQTK